MIYVWVWACQKFINVQSIKLGKTKNFENLSFSEKEYLINLKNIQKRTQVLFCNKWTNLLKVLAQNSFLPYQKWSFCESLSYLLNWIDLFIKQGRYLLNDATWSKLKANILF